MVSQKLIFEKPDKNFLIGILATMRDDPSSKEYADEVARLRACESDSDAELLVRPRNLPHIVNMSNRIDRYVS